MFYMCNMYMIAIVVLQTLRCLNVATASPKFRILAPEFICPKDEQTPIEKPDNTIITIQTAAGSNFEMNWVVRWTPLPKPTQRFTLMIWKTVRALEAKLNKPQPVPYVYVIENDELLTGVDYVFTIKAIDNGLAGMPRVFHIDNTQGDQKLGLIEGRSDLISIILVGGQITFADAGYTLEAVVIACFETQDYYFIWTVKSTGSHDIIDVSHISGSRLEIPPNLLQTGTEYYANCEVIRPSTRLRITQSGLDFNVLKRGLEVYLSVDYLQVSKDYAFSIDVITVNHDYYGQAASYNLKCTFENEECNEFELYSDNTTVTILSSGLSKIGRYFQLYILTLCANLLEETASAEAVVEVVEHKLPIIQIFPIPRLVNEGTTLTLTANATNVAPTCTLTWYFATQEYPSSSNFISNSTSESNEHGEALTETVIIYSIQETFLNELIDYTNETEWRQMTAQAPAKAGRARFLAECGCSITFECSTLGSVYADLNFELNEAPKPGAVMISPEAGVAMETVFRVSTLAVVDPDGPLTYSFFCRISSDDALLLGSYSQHLAIETMLPYIEGGTEVWVEVCDIPGACSKSESKIIDLNPGEAKTLQSLIDATRAHVRRCEIILMQKVVLSTVVTYKTTSRDIELAKFTASLQESISTITEVCIDSHYEMYSAFLNKLMQVGLDIVK